MIKRLTPEEFRELYVKKGWNTRNLSLFWRMTPQWLNRLVADENRAQHWDDAVRGLKKFRKAYVEGLPLAV
ncbi:hypothetical protein HNP46_006353 [Pseudomonas nitritireducens]|uniref:XRE family transcriptional regulator n=1 Tax=Pseudomonas nitroreducens TaxID=46680 RepID=A0A7W7P585_PSENT|nr:hypothetical protein [Pseudomonas nitritireducens]MBB4867440.1 hypothetical protein [Pseudomonas nitritireducens]